VRLTCSNHVFGLRQRGAHSERTNCLAFVKPEVLGGWGDGGGDGKDVHTVSLLDVCGLFFFFVFVFFFFGVFFFFFFLFFWFLLGGVGVRWGVGGVVGVEVGGEGFGSGM